VPGARRGEVSEMPPAGRAQLLPADHPLFLHGAAAAAPAAPAPHKVWQVNLSLQSELASNGWPLLPALVAAALDSVHRCCPAVIVSLQHERGSGVALMQARAYCHPGLWHPFEGG
jgi:hypothetical protein